MEKNIKRWPNVVIGMIVFLFAGTIYAWSIFAQIFKNNFPSWSSAELATTFTIIMGFFCLGILSSGVLAKKMSPRKIMMVAGIFIGIGFIGASRVQENNIWLLYIAFGMVGSLGVGLVYNAVLSLVTKWFPEKVGMISGILMMSFAFSTLIVGLSVNYLVDIIDWRTVFAVLGVIIAAVVIICSGLLKEADPNLLRNYIKVSDKKSSAGIVNLTVNEMVKTRAFWLFIFWTIMNFVCVYSVMGNAKQCVLELNVSAISIATISVTLISICNGVGRLILGTAYDKIGRNKTMIIITCLMIVASVIMVAAFKFSSIPMLLIGFMLVGLGYGGIPPTASAFTVDYFGSENYSLKFGFVNLSILVGAFGSTLAGIIKDTVGSYQNLFYILIALGIVAVIINFGIKKPMQNADTGVDSGNAINAGDR